MEDDRFLDNPNVLFEAGMLHVCRENTADSIKGWIPIREDAERTTPIPFNFAGDSVLIVPRESNAFSSEEFYLDLSARLNSILA